MKKIQEKHYLIIGKAKDGIEPKLAEHIEKHGIKPSLIFIRTKTMKQLYPELFKEFETYGIWDYEGIPVIKMKSKAMIFHWGNYVLPNKEE